MSDFSKRLILQISVTLGVLFALAGGIVFFGGKITDATDKIVAARTDLRTWSSSLQSYVDIKSQYTAKAAGDIVILNNVLPTQDQLIDLRKDFQFLAGGSNLSLNFSFTGERSTDSSQIGALGISLDLEGDFPTILAFIQKLQSFHYLLSIDSITFDQKEKTMTALLRGEVFFKK